ncbi:5-oxoprolinase subunit PxpB [Falsibacillus pallidus]|uniref:Inhibitor of KinA n=1 Tax=Falsibacillus pallidus TaxID=493781 RepID=A0A370GHN8_9BACI|nr:5-oxoprolinase subunit PxpB [Falsibacillus pallidus]RDI43167.1 inhibitor of KinA [Falsibacillus pallidus]
MPISYQAFPLGDSAIMLKFGQSISPAINKKIHLACTMIEQANFPFVRDIVPAFTTLTIHYEPFHFDSIHPYKKMEDLIAGVLLKEESNIQGEQRQIEIPVCYHSKFALDLEELSINKQLSKDEIIEAHISPVYSVYFIGFSPGFPFLGPVDKKIASPRKTNPRILVPKGSVGIVGSQTGIYPVSSPGGWQIIGRTPIDLFNLEDSPPVKLTPGMDVKFYPITLEEFENWRED